MNVLVSAGKVPDTQSLSSGWLNAFRSLNHNAIGWFSDKECAFDVFDRVQPEVFWIHSSDLTRETVKAVCANKETKVILFVNDWEAASEQERSFVSTLVKNGTQLAFSTAFKERLFECCEGWKSIGLQTLSCLPAADTTRYAPAKISNKDSSDISFIGCYESSKEANIVNYVFPLLHDFDLKIYGYGYWPVANYLGSLNKDMFNTIVSNTKVNLSVSHNHLKGTTPSERIFKILACGKIPLIHQSCQAYKDTFPVARFFKSKLELFEQVAQMLKTETTNSQDLKALEFIKNGHSYIDRVNKTLDILGVKKYE